MHIHILYREDNQIADYQDFISDFRASLQSFKLEYDFIVLNDNPKTALNIDRIDIIIFLAFQQVEESYNIKILSSYTAQGIPRDNIFVVSISNHVLNLYNNYKGYAFLDRKDRNYWITLLELLYDLKACIKSQERHKPTIYLASAPSDMVVIRNSIKWELQQHGYRILPEVNLNLVTPERLIAFINQNIADTILSIHFFNDEYSKPIPELRSSIAELEYDIVKDFTLENSNFKYFVWLSVTSDEINNVNQKNIIQKIENMSLSTNSQIIKGNTNEFNLILHRYLNSIYQISFEEQPPEVYCIFAGIDKIKFQNAFLKSTARNTVFSFKLIDQNFYEHINRQQHQDYLRQVKTCLIFVDRASEKWLHTNLQDVIKAIATGRQTKWKNIYIVYPRAEKHKIQGLEAKFASYYNLLKPIELERLGSETLYSKL